MSSSIQLVRPAPVGWPTAEPVPRAIPGVRFGTLRRRGQGVCEVPLLHVLAAVLAVDLEADLLVPFPALASIIDEFRGES